MSRPTPPPPPIDVIHQYALRPRPDSIRYLGGAGGFSGADFWRFETTDDRALCVRRWPPRTEPSRIVEVHGVIFRAADAGIDFLAVPFRRMNGSSYFELDHRLYEVSPWLEGCADYHATPSRGRLQNALVALARLHQALVEDAACRSVFQAAPGVVARRNRVAQLVAGQLQIIADAVARRGESRLATIAREILHIAKPRLPELHRQLTDASTIRVPVQFCLRDVRHDHLLFIQDRVSGIVDYDAIRIDSVALDVVRLGQSLIGNDPQLWETALAAYRSVRPLDQHECQLLPVLRNANPLLSAFTWLEWLFVEQRQFDDPTQVQQRLCQLVTLLD